MQVPAFLARQFIVRGSLRNTDRGFSLEVQNPIGDGTLVGVGHIVVDGRAIPQGAVSAHRAGDAAPILATSITREQPVSVRRGDRVTLFVEGERLAPGDHELRVQLEEAGLGPLSFTLTERLAAD